MRSKHDWHATTVVASHFLCDERTIGVVTGSTSLITVPAMSQFHIEPRIALATNMFALTFMSVGGALPFLRGQGMNRKRLPLLIALTLAGSLIGALAEGD